MPQHGSFRQVEERNVASDVELMEWSPKMDLIALSNVQGEVVLHRLTWNKVWTMPSRGDDIRVTAMVWRPDGKVLAVGYSSGCIVLANVENADTLHMLEMNSSITTASWVSASDELLLTDSATNFQDKSVNMLPRLPSLSKSYGSVNKITEENIEDSKKLSDQKQLNVLITGTENGNLYLHIFGIFPSGELDLNESVSEEADKACKHSVLSAVLSENLENLTVLVKTTKPSGEMEVKIMLFTMPLIASHHKELHFLALKYSQILSLMSYLSTTIRSISEAWEDILLEIDSKLTNYAEEKFRLSSGTVSDDFLELLMFGTPTDELEKFLMYDLTEKGLKKLGHSIELSYSNIQKLVLKHLQSVGQAILYHLCEIKGMGLWHEKFGLLGLTSTSIQTAVTVAGSFMMKATEIQQVIDNSMRNFKAFFRWLYVVILRLSDEPVPSEINKVNQQDLNFVAEFLTENFASEWDHNKKSSFNLEKVGQYLKKENLPFPPDTSQNPWEKFLETHPNLKASPLLFPHHTERSLVQQHEELQNAVTDALTHPSTVIGKALKLNASYSIYQGPKYDPHLTQVHSQSREVLYTVVTLSSLPCSNMMMIQQDLGKKNEQSHSIKTLKLAFTSLALPSPHMNFSYRILDVKFYSEDVLSVLLMNSSNEGTSVLCQASIKKLLEIIHAPTVFNLENRSLADFMQNEINIGKFTEVLRFRQLENLKPHSLAVSGSRRVACVLFASKRRVRLFEMDVDEDDEDADESMDTTPDKLNYFHSEKHQRKDSLSSEKMLQSPRD